MWKIPLPPHLARPEDDSVEMLRRRLGRDGLEAEEIRCLLHYLLSAYRDSNRSKAVVHTEEVLMFCEVDREREIEVAGDNMLNTITNARQT